MRAALAGATGLVGGRVLRRLLDDPAVTRVVAPTRRPLPAHPKLDNPLLSGSWPALPPVDEAYGCLGTTRKDAGSAEAFRAVDFDLAVGFAAAARAAGAGAFGLVSSLGADADSSFLYPRVKGEAEDAISALGFASLAIIRPSLLLGARERPRPAERLGEVVFAALDPLLLGPLSKYRAVAADEVASALVGAVRKRVPGDLVIFPR
ncbi:MAG: hypothetical protein M0D55_00170 [Elusimicrobiota bacterium]|nr:MAG: hypothetical protein M0D55_00170 [Elusimicrobiota bacterium]